MKQPIGHPHSPLLGRTIYFVLAGVAGLGVSLATVGLIELIGVVQLVLYGESDETRFAAIAAALPGWRTVAALVVGGLVTGLLIRWLPGQRYHGIADVMEACAFTSGRMGVRSGFGAAIAAAVSIGAGAPLGREGPAVHIGASISAWLAERLKLNHNQSLALLGCGAAAAVTTSFNAPIAGVLFALEVIVGYYTLRVFAPVVVASAVAVVIRHLFYGSTPIFELPGLQLESLTELVVCALLGIVGAATVQLFITGNALVLRGWQAVRVPTWLRPAVAGLVIGIIAVRYPMILGIGYEPVYHAMREMLPLKEMLVLLILRLVTSAIATSSGFAGGVFGTAVVLGAMLGGVWGMILGGLDNALVSTSSVYVVVGLASVSAAMLGAPISTVLLVFEITRSYEITIAVMTAVAFSTSIMQVCQHRSFFRWQLAQRGVNISDGRNHSLLMGHTVDKLVTPGYASIHSSKNIREAERLLGELRRRVLIITDEDGRFVGFTDLRELMASEVAGQAEEVGAVMYDAANSISDTTNVVAALQKMASLELDYLPVTSMDGDELQVAGILFKSDLLREHYEVLRQARDNEFGVT